MFALVNCQVTSFPLFYLLPSEHCLLLLLVLVAFFPLGQMSQLPWVPY